MLAILTTPTEASAHSTPKMAKFSPNGHSTANRNNGEAPRTPTPFKRALAEVYRGREPLSNTPQTPTKRVEDLTEIIKKDMLDDLTDMSYNDVSGEHQVKASQLKSIRPASCFSFRPFRIAATAGQTRGRTVATRDLTTIMTMAIRRTRAPTKR